MSDSTNILELPSETINNSNPTQLPLSNNNNNIPVSLDQSTISQIVNGLQQASSTGITQLPSRDIPMNTESIVQDPFIQPNYIPPPPIQDHLSKNRDYIENNDNMENMIHNYNKQMNKNDSLDDIYNELQTPLFLSVLYFLFQLPIFKKILFKYFSVLFSIDGNYNINGYLFTSVLFGLLFYFFMKVTVFFNTF